MRAKDLQRDPAAQVLLNGLEDHAGTAVTDFSDDAVSPAEDAAHEDLGGRSLRRSHDRQSLQITSHGLSDLLYRRKRFQRKPSGWDRSQPLGSAEPPVIDCNFPMTKKDGAVAFAKLRREV